MTVLRIIYCEIMFEINSALGELLKATVCGWRIAMLEMLRGGFSILA